MVHFTVPTLLTLLAVLSAGCAHMGPRPAHGTEPRSRRVYDVLMERRVERAPVTPRPEARLERRLLSLKRCPGVDGRAMVYALGSSTMASLLGPAVERMLADYDVEFRTWGKPSSGLARPDFHDWRAKIPIIAARHDPDIWVVSLGTNDYQALRTRSGGWIRLGTKRWAREYARRVRRMLELMTGPARDRTVIWVGPTAFPGRGSREVGSLIVEILHREMAAFGGPVFLVDAYTRMTDDQNRVLEQLDLPGRDTPLELHGDDGIHMTMEAVRALLARPAVHRVKVCLERPDEDS